GLGRRARRRDVLVQERVAPSRLVRSLQNNELSPQDLRLEGLRKSLSVPDEKDLVERCRKGDDEAWRQMVDHLGQRVYSVAYHFTLKREDAEELSQEVFLKIFENLHRYDGSYPLLAWVVSLARNLCIDRYRRRKREKSFRFVSDDAVAPLLQSGDDPAAAAIQKERTKL